MADSNGSETSIQAAIEFLELWRSRGLWFLLHIFLAQYLKQWGNIIGPILANDLAIFESYAHRIRYLYIDGEDIPITSYIQVLAVCQRSYLLPQLRYLHITGTDVVDTTFIISPSLQGLYTEISCEDEGGIFHPNISAALNMIPHMAPTLRHLDVSHFLPPHCLSTVLEMRQLRTLSLDHCSDVKEHCIHIPCNRLIDLLSFPNLLDFKLVGNIILSPNENSTWSPVELTSLKILTLEPRSSDLANVEGLFRQARFPELEELELRLSPTSNPVRSDAKYWSLFCSSLLDSATSNLHGVRISASGGMETRKWAGLELTLEDLSGLFELDLVEFTTIGILHAISENDIVKLAGSWNRLQRLEIRTCRSPKLDFAALVVIASKLPCLRHLSIEIDARKLTASAVPILKHRLHLLRLYRSPLKEPVVLAQSLDKIFPHLSEFSLITSGSKASEVKPILRALQQARRDHEKRLDCVSDVAFNKDEAQD